MRFLVFQSSSSCLDLVKQHEQHGPHQQGLDDSITFKACMALTAHLAAVKAAVYARSQFEPAQIPGKKEPQSRLLKGISPLSLHIIILFGNVVIGHLHT